MAKTIFTGWRTVTPGNCPQCGFATDWGVDGRGNVQCACNCDDSDGFDFTDAGCGAHHNTGVDGRCIYCGMDSRQYAD